VSAARALERLRLGKGAWHELVVQEEAHARANAQSRATALRRAAIIVELRTGDLEGAARLRRESIADGEITALEDLARLYRRIGDRARLAAIYRREAQEREKRAQAQAQAAGGG